MNPYKTEFNFICRVCKRKVLFSPFKNDNSIHWKCKKKKSRGIISDKELKKIRSIVL